MARYRRRGSRKTSYRKRRYPKKRRYVRKVVRRALQSRGLLHPEVKHARHGFENAPITGAFDQNATTAFLDVITQGAGETEYVGAKICAKALQFRGMIQNGSATPANVRIIIVEDLQPVVGTLYLQKTLTSPGYEILEDSSIFSLYNNPYPRRFKVLFDKTWCMYGSTGQETARCFKGYIRLGNAQISFSPAVGGGHYPMNRAYFMFAVADEADCTLTMFSDLTYTDV